MVTGELKRVNAEYETLKEHTLPMKDIENIDVSNLAEHSNEGMFYTVISDRWALSRVYKWSHFKTQQFSI